MRAAIVVVLLCASAGVAHAAGATAALSEAQAHLYAGEYADALRLAEPLTADETLPRADRAEAWRVTGLALFFMNRLDEADAAFHEYLKLEPEAHLDPALVPPEAVAFFEGVRSRHAGELRKLRPRPRRGHVLVNLIPPAGQFQNGEPGKGWALGVTEGLLLATNITTFYMLEDMCDRKTGLCDSDSAKTLQNVNILSGGLLIGVLVYGAVDGYLGWRKRGDAPPSSNFSLAPTPGGGAMVFSTEF